MNEDGWLAREQILGEEARSKVCITTKTKRSPPSFRHNTLILLILLHLSMLYAMNYVIIAIRSKSRMKLLL